MTYADIKNKMKTLGFSDEEFFKIVIENGRLYLYYETSFSKWKEIVREASEEYLVTENEDGIRYIYKRYEPLDLK